MIKSEVMRNIIRLGVNESKRPRVSNSASVSMFVVANVFVKTPALLFKMRFFMFKKHPEMTNVIHQ